MSNSQILILKGMVGPGKPFDTDRFFFILPTALGSPGSSCPSVSGLGPGFPKYSVADMVRAQHLLITRHLNIHHLAGAAGASMGGFQTLQWITDYPDFMDWAIPIATAPETMGRLLGRSAVRIDIIRLDPEYKDGRYAEQPKKGKGLSHVKAMTLVIGVNDDELFPPSSFKSIADAIPGARLFTYDSILGHPGCALDLQKAGEAITGFLK